MAVSYDVAEAKNRLSELLSRAAYGHERFLIRKRGKPVAAIVSTDDLGRLESDAPEPQGVLSAAGLLADFPEWHEAMLQAVAIRESLTDREVDLQ